MMDLFKLSVEEKFWMRVQNYETRTNFGLAISCLHFNLIHVYVDKERSYKTIEWLNGPSSCHANKLRRIK